MGYERTTVMWKSGMKYAQQSCLTAFLALTRPFALQAEAVTVSAGGLFSAAADLPGAALVTHWCDDRSHKYPFFLGLNWRLAYLCTHLYSVPWSFYEAWIKTAGICAGPLILLRERSRECLMYSRIRPHNCGQKEIIYTRGSTERVSGSLHTRTYYSVPLACWRAFDC